MAAANLPEQLAAVEERIRHRFPDATIEVDTPSDPKGPWFLDISLQGHVVAVQWRQDRGFGISTNPSDGGYGEGVHERFEGPDSAYKRITALLLGQASTAPPEPVRLRELRALRGVSQMELAEALNVQQAAVSRFENRKDNILLSTLKAVVASMGGELIVTVKFPDGLERQLKLDDDIESPPPASTLVKAPT